MPSGVELATAWVTLVPTMQGVNGEVARALGPVEDEADASGTRSGRRFSDGFKRGFMLLGAAVAVGVGAALVSAVNSASDLNEAGTAVGAIFGSAFGDINKWAAKANSTLGQSHLEALNAAKSFGVYGQAAGLSNEENAKFSTGLAELATDFASFHNVPVADAIEAIGAGLRGEAEPLRRFGILLDDASLRAKAMEMGIYDGNGSLTAQQKILASQALIFEQAGAAQGDFARTSEGMANQQKILGASLENLSASIGTMLLPMVTSIVTALGGFATWATTNMWIFPVLATVVGGVLTVAFGLWAASIWAATVALLANPVTWIIVGIVALIAALVALVLNWDTVVAWVTSVWNGFISWIISVTDGFVSWWNSIWAAVGAFLQFAWNLYVSTVTGIWNGFIGWIMGIINGFFGWWNGIWTAVGNAINTIWRVFLAVIQVLFGDQINWLMTKINAFSNWWNAIWGAVGQAIRSIWQNFVSIVTSIWNGFISWITGVINGFFGWWNGIWATVGSALSAGFNAAKAVATSVVNGMLSWLRGAVDGFFGWWNGVWGTVGNAISNAFNGVASFVAGVWNRIVSTVRGAVNGIIGSINGMIGALNGFLGAVNAIAGTNMKVGKIPGLAKGGTVTGSGSVLVGENGPEILRLPKGASVDPDITNTGGRSVIFQNYAPLGQSPAQALSQFANRAEGFL